MSGGGGGGYHPQSQSQSQSQSQFPSLSQFNDDSDSHSDSDLHHHLPPLIPNLPDDIAARCIARLPLSSHPSLSLVSRSWRSLIRPRPHHDLLFSLRSQLRLLEPFLVLCVRSPSHPSLCFLFHPLRRRRGAHPLPSPPVPTAGSAALPLGPAVLLLGGSHHNLPTRSVQILHPRLRRWSLGPPMLSPRHFPAAASISGRFYAAGGCLPQSPHWAESLDPAASPPSWAPVHCPVHLRDQWMHGHAVLSGKLLAVADRGGVVFDPVTAAWGPVTSALDLGWKGRAAVVGDILYTYDYLGKIKGYYPSRDEWLPVEGLDRRGLPRFLCGATLADLGGLLCLVWEGKTKRAKAGVEICCAGIEISRMDGGGLMGKIVWVEDAVLVLPRGSTIAHCVSVEL